MTTKEIPLYRSITNDEREAAKQAYIATLPEEDARIWQYKGEGKRIALASLACRLCGKWVRNKPFARAAHGKMHERDGDVYSRRPDGYTTEYFVNPEALMTPEEREQRDAREARKKLLNDKVREAWSKVGEFSEDKVTKLVTRKWDLAEVAEDETVTEEAVLEIVREIRALSRERAEHTKALQKARNAALAAVGSSWDEWYYLTQGREAYLAECQRTSRFPMVFE